MTQRTAGLDLEWRRIFPDEYRAILPDIPGLTTSSDDNSVDIQGISGSWMFTIWLDLVCGFPVCLFNKDFDIPNGSSFEEMKQAVENLSIEDITRKVVEQADKLVDDEFTDEELEAFHQLLNQYATASRHASKRTADLDLDWWQTSAGMWAADLPEIPGFPCAPGRYWHVSITSMYSDDTDEFLGYGFNIGILDAHGGVTLFENEFGFPYVDTQEEAMQEVESLSPEMIAQTAEDAGLEPVDNVSASRKGKHMARAASKRKAGFEGLNWNQDSNGYIAVLPDMPDLADPSPVNVEQNLIGGWTFSLHLTLKDGNHILLTNHDFGISDGDTPQEMKQAVDDLDQFDIEDVLTEEYLPQMQSLNYYLQKQEDEAYDDDSEEEFASRKGKHMIRKASKRTASLDLDWEETTDTFGDPLYQAVLPAIPGYPYSGDGNSTVSIGLDGFDSTGETYTWWMDIQVGKNKNVRLGDYELTGMGSYPLDYEMGYLDGLSVEWIADKLAEKGYMPEEE